MNSSAGPLHTLNTIPAAQVAELAAPTQEPRLRSFGAHRRQSPDPAIDVMELTRPFLFRDLPGRVDGDYRLRRPKAEAAQASSRAWTRNRRSDLRLVSRRHCHVSSAVFVQHGVNGTTRALVWTVLVELALVGLVVAGVLLRGRA